jgi:hypothetical protein
MSADRLRELLGEGVDDCATLQKELAAGNERAWHVAVGADLAYLGEHRRTRSRGAAGSACSGYWSWPWSTPKSTAPSST